MSQLDLTSLEREEREAPLGRPSFQVYGNLMVAYLLDDQLCSAKFLWQRIPDDVKTAHDELKQLWTIGKALFLRDPAKVHGSLADYAWPSYLEEPIHKLKDYLRCKYLHLMTSAYTSISLSEFSNYVGLNGQPEQAFALARSQPGWRVEPDSELLWPAKSPGLGKNMKGSEEKLSQLTDYITFLEK